jgi:hypothetical protein
LWYVFITIWDEGTLLIPTPASLILLSDTAFPVMQRKSIPTLAFSIVLDCTVLFDVSKIIAPKGPMPDIVLDVILPPAPISAIIPFTVFVMVFFDIDIGARLSADIPSELGLTMTLSVTLPPN